MLARVTQMQWNPSNFFEWVQMCSTQVACLEELNRYRWEIGLACSTRSHDKFRQLKHRHLHECTKYGRQVLPTAGTAFVHTQLQLPKRFVAINLLWSEQGRVSIERFSKTGGMTWPTANRMHRHQVNVTLLEKMNKSLPKVHIVISNFKSFLAGTFHGVSHRYLQDFIDEFIFHFNRRFWEPQLPDRLLQAADDHEPIRASLKSVLMHVN